MSPKQMILELVRRLPDTATISEIADEIELIRHIELADAEITAGHYYTQDEVVAFFREGVSLPDVSEGRPVSTGNIS